MQRTSPGSEPALTPSATSLYPTRFELWCERYGVSPDEPAARRTYAESQSTPLVA